MQPGGLYVVCRQHMRTHCFKQSRADMHPLQRTVRTWLPKKLGWRGLHVSWRGLCTRRVLSLKHDDLPVLYTVPQLFVLLNRDATWVLKVRVATITSAKALTSVGQCDFDPRGRIKYCGYEHVHRSFDATDRMFIS